MNFPLFHAEARRLRALGYRVVNPAEIKQEPGAGWHACMRRDLAELLKCDAIAVLPGWRQSRGAQLEYHLAESLDMRLMEAQKLTEPVRLPLEALLESEPVRFTIYGEAASKANSRRTVPVPQKGGGTVIKSIKSDKALDYEAAALFQIPSHARKRFTGRIRMTLCLYYASERPDLDESLLLDVLQDRYSGKGKTRKLIQSGVYCNDRQVRERHVYHFIDKYKPRAEIEVQEIPS